MPVAKSPYKNYTLAEIMAAESVSYVIQVGRDFFIHDGKFFFTKKSAIVYYNKILNQLLDILEGGDEEERADALRCISNLHVLSLKVH